MNSKIRKKCCFIGHRKIKNDSLEEKVYNIVEKLIAEEGVDTFYFGSKSQFDDLCYKVVTKLKEKYPNIVRIYVRAEYPYVDDAYKAYLLTYYEDTYYPAKILNAGKAAYVERNLEMIDNSDYCVVYFDEKYLPQGRKNNKPIYYQSKSGTKTAFEYAEERRKEIINTAKKLI